LLRSGDKTDYAIVPEPTGLDLIGVESTGGMDGAIHVYGEMGLFTGVNALGKMWKLLSFMGMPGDNCVVHEPEWLRFNKGSEKTRFFVGCLNSGIGDDIIHEPKGSSDICTAYIDIRPTYLDMMPTEESVLEDLENVLGKFRKEDPYFRADLECPLPSSTHGIAMNTPPDAPVVKSLAKWAKYITGTKVKIGKLEKDTTSDERDKPDYLLKSNWNYQDGGHLSKAGIETCVYGPSSGGSSNCPNEYTRISEVIKATKILALTIVDICG